MTALKPLKTNTMAIPFKPLHNNHPHNVAGLEKKISSLLINYIYSSIILVVEIKRGKIVTSTLMKLKCYFDFK
jgi:hypothetical protein